MPQELLQSERLRQDPRIIEARRLIAEAVREHQAPIRGARRPIKERSEGYAAMLRQFAELRGGGLFYPYLGSGIGNGSLVELLDGSVKYDMITGIGVHVFGHSDPELIDATLTAALSDTVMQGNLQQNRESAALCQQILDLACQSGAELRHCFLTTSGATANENALKILFQAKSPASRLLAFENGFSGRTLATAQITDRAKNRVGLPTTLAVDYLPYFDANNASQSIARSVASLQQHLQRYPGQHAGMVMELIQGEGGYNVAPREFFVAIAQALREQKVPILFDEIQTFGRTTRPFAFQHLELDAFADVVTIGKMTQVCATLFREELAPRPGLISQTFTAATASIFAARSLLERLHSGDFFGTEGRIARIHERFVSHFERIRTDFPDRLTGPWGVGGMLACTVFDGSDAVTRQVLDALFEAGVIAFSAGSRPTRIRMLPPVGVITDEEIDSVCAILSDVIESIEPRT